MHKLNHQEFLLADRLGYEDQLYLSRVFKAYTGCSQV
ncbi:AraC family transcriptional regulator [Agarilytica rhodophyticola]